MPAENGPVRSASPASLLITILCTTWGRTPGRTLLSLHAVTAANRLSAGQFIPAIGYLLKVSATPQKTCRHPAGSTTHAEGTPEIRCQPLERVS